LKKLLALFLIVFLGIVLSFSFLPNQVQAAEPSLIEVLNHLGFTNIAEVPIETFPAGTYNVTLYAEFAAYHAQNEISYYEVGTTTYNLLISGPEGGFGYINPPLTKIFTVNSQFGLSMYTPEGHRYFTENYLNPDGEIHSKIYRNLDDPEMFLIGFENLYGAGDRDYQDFVFSIRKCSVSVGGLEVLLQESVIFAPLAYLMISAVFCTVTITLWQKKR